MRLLLVRLLLVRLLLVRLLGVRLPLIIQYSSCSLVSIVVVVLVDIRDRDAIGARSVDELEITIALNLSHNADMVDAGGRTEEYEVTYMHVVTIIDGQTLTPLVTAAAAEMNVERLINKTGETGTVKGIRAHATATIRATDIVLSLLDDLRTRNVEQSLQLWMNYRFVFPTLQNRARCTKRAAGFLILIQK